jgi:hypothetical protein
VRPMKIQGRTSMAVYSLAGGEPKGRPDLIEFSLGGGGDQGDPVEESTHPKPPGVLTHLRNPKAVPMVKTTKIGMAATSASTLEAGTMAEQGSNHRGGKSRL